MQQRKWLNLLLLSLASLFAMSLWFSASAVLPQLTAEWHLNGAQQSWLTMGVQLGFVVGALVSALLNLGDRLESRKLFAVCAILGGAANAAIPVFRPDFPVVLLLRFVTGAAIAGIYPPGMKLIATWCKADLGFGIGLLVGALTFGKSLPHLLNAIGRGGMPPWSVVFLASSAMAAAASILGWFFVRPGPHLNQKAPFDWKFAWSALRIRPSRFANFGYLGHMWELYAMWTWVPIFLLASYESAGRSLQAARFAGFTAIAAGSAGCILAGILADRLGRTIVAGGSLLLSGICCVTVGFFFDSPAAVTVICLIWGFAVVADSAQFSAAVSELSDPRYVGTALTVQTCLGFLLTMLTIRLIPVMVDWVGWRNAFSILALGPVFGLWNMIRLRRLPESAQMASGNR